MARLVSTHNEAALREAQDYKLRSKSFRRLFGMSSPASDEISRLGGPEGQVVGIAESVPRMREELECLEEEMVELTRGISTVKVGLVNFSDSDFLELQRTVGRQEAEIACLRQVRFDMPRTLSRGPAEGSRAPVPVYSGERSTLSIFVKLFQTWALTHDAEDTLVTTNPIRVVGRERAELDCAHGREKVNHFVAAWTGLVKGNETDKSPLDMLITAGSPS